MGGGPRRRQKGLCFVVDKQRAGIQILVSFLPSFKALCVVSIAIKDTHLQVYNISVFFLDSDTQMLSSQSATVSSSRSFSLIAGEMLPTVLKNVSLPSAALRPPYKCKPYTCKEDGLHVVDD